MLARPENFGPRNRASELCSGWQKRGTDAGDGKGVGTKSEGQDSGTVMSPVFWRRGF